MIHNSDRKILQQLRELRTSNTNPNPNAVEALTSQLSETGYQLAVEIGLLTQLQMQRTELRQPSNQMVVAVKNSLATNVIHLEIKAVKGEPRVDSRLIAPGLGIQHKAFMETLRKYSDELKELGVLPFKTAKPISSASGGRPETYALLNEDQAVFAMTLSRNTQQVVKLKLRLVMAFCRFREGLAANDDYLPFYHDLHDEVKHLAESAHDAGSTTPERIFHININKLINKVFGLEAGQRPDLQPEMRALVTTANIVVKDSLKASMNAGHDHKTAYAEAKAKLQAYAATVMDKPLLAA